MTLQLRSATTSDVGLVRKNNEDSAHAGRRLIVIADGIGGMPSGELASDVAVKALTPLEKSNPASGEAALVGLRDAIETANGRIRDLGTADPTHDGMGTTVTAMLLAGDQMAMVHVGDSRGYLWRAGDLTQLTKDDTFVQSLVDEGVLTAAQARSHPRRSLVTQAVQGVEYTPSCSIITVRPGDRLLLCSDGLSDVVDDAEIAQALAAYSEPKKCARQLVRLALAGGAPDNVTVVVADVAG